MSDWKHEDKVLEALNASLRKLPRSLPESKLHDIVANVAFNKIGVAVAQYPDRVMREEIKDNLREQLETAFQIAEERIAARRENLH